MFLRGFFGAPWAVSRSLDLLCFIGEFVRGGAPVSGRLRASVRALSSSPAHLLCFIGRSARGAAPCRPIHCVLSVNLSQAFNTWRSMSAARGGRVGGVGGNGRSTVFYRSIRSRRCSGPADLLCFIGESADGRWAACGRCRVREAGFQSIVFYGVFACVKYRVLQCLRVRPKHT